MTAVLALRERLAAQGQKVSFDAIVVRALSQVLVKFEQFRQSMAGEEVLAAGSVNVGFAVSAGKELYTPTVFDADRKSLVEIDREIRELTEKARQGKLSATEMSGALMTISNLGMLPVIEFTAVIPPGQSAALAMGATENMVVADAAGAMSVEPMATVTLSVDHRIINGRQGAEFLAAVKQTVEAVGREP